MDNYISLKEQIKDKLIGKANLKQKVYYNTVAVFTELKELLHEMSSEMNDELEDQLDKQVKIDYRDRGKFEAQLQVAEDMLFFCMHTDVYKFNREHIIWENDYAKGDSENSFCGMISIYNFLNDSLKYNRSTDEGYLIARIFINHDMQYFVEGKRQETLRHDAFGVATIDRDAMINIIETAINFALEFDLLAPPYDLMKTITVEQLSTKLEHTKLKTSKRLGFGFNTDDV